MEKAASPKAGFNKTIFCLYQATSDDLMVWCWFDVLILSLNFGLNMTQISLVFSVSLMAALLMKIPANRLVKRLKPGKSVLLSAFLFLAAALLLTFGRTLAMAILGQSLYLIAMTFQEMSTVIAKNAARRDPAGVDYMRIMSAAGTIHSVISLIAAVFMTKLYDINANLPMYICLGFCLSSCVLAWFVSRFDGNGGEETEETRREVLPGAKKRSYDKTTLSCLILSVLFMVIFSVSGDNLKILIEDGLSAVADKSRTVFLFSMLLLVSRLVKIGSNLLLYVCRKKNIRHERLFFVIILGGVLIPVMGFMTRWETGYQAVLLASAAFLTRVLVFDPFRFSIYDYMLKRLKEEKMVDVLFVHSTGSDIFTAVFSLASTVLLSLYGMQAVMKMLLILSLIFGAAYLILRRNLIRVSGNRRFLKWKPSDIEGTDDLLVAAAALLMHYGIVEDPFFTPKRLAEKISSAEDINTANSQMRFDGSYDYNEETLKDLFDAGHPCAVRAVISGDGKAFWLPVLYLDDDGGIVWNPYSKERFLAQFDQISGISCFTILEKKSIFEELAI